MVLPWLPILLASSSAEAHPPRVVHTDPPSGAVDVDPTIRELVITFDQPMDPAGFSIGHVPGRGPGAAGDTYWRDDHTFVDPVRLAPDRQYGLILNFAGDRGFRNLQGELAAPFGWNVVTAPEPTSVPPTQANARTLARLRRAVDEDYAHRELYGVDWEERFASFEAPLLAARTANEFARIASELLSIAPDGHLALDRGGWPWLMPSVAPANVDRVLLPRLVPAWEEAPNGAVATGRFANGVTYLRVSEWMETTRAELDRVQAAIAGADPQAGLVVDVRDNTGGDERFALAVAGCFVREPVPYASVRVLRNGQWKGPFVNEVPPNPGCPPFPATRVAVLQGPASASTNESFLKMMQLAGAALVGETSAGSSGRPVPHRLGRGLVLGLPSWIETWPDGTPTEGIGILPTVPVAWAPDGGAEAASDEVSDPVLDAALAWLGR